MIGAILTKTRGNLNDESFENQMLLHMNEWIERSTDIGENVKQPKPLENESESNGNQRSKSMEMDVGSILNASCPNI